MPGTMNLSPVVKVGGSAISESYRNKLTLVRVSRELGLVGRAQLRFVDFGNEMSGSSTFSLGSTVAVSDANGTSVFSGKVTGVSLDQGEGHLPELVVTADDAAYSLGLKTTTQAHLNKTYAAILGDALTGTGLSVSSMVAETAQQAYVLQSGNNMDFLNEVCLRTGRVWWVDGTSLKFEKLGTSSGSVSLEYGDDLESFAVKASGNYPDEVKVVGWDPAQQAEISGTANTADSAESNLVSGYPGRTSASHSIVVRDAAPMTATEATTIATSIQKELQSESVIAKGKALFNASIKLGATATVTMAGPASGSYYITAIEHLYDSRGYFTYFTAGSYRPSHLVDVLGGSKRDTGFSLNGVLTGVVTNVDTSSDQNAKPGMVKVKYSTQGSTVESPWARVASIGGGKGAGIEFLPQVNDEVLVAFEQGDTRRPIVIAGLFSTKNTLPDSPAAGNVENKKVTYRRITTPTGAMIELSDGESDDKKYIKIQLADKKTIIRLGTDKSEITLDSKELTIGNSKGSITLKDSGDIEIKGEAITIKGNKDVTIEATQKLGAKGQTTQIEGQTDLKIKSSATASVEASAPLALKGAMVNIN